MSIRFFYNFCLKDDDPLTGDILSAVRRTYFNSFGHIRDRITVNSDEDAVVYEYNIEKDKPMRWSVKRGDTLLQEMTEGDRGKYNICFYKDSKLVKRLMFSKLHTLLRCEYYDPETGEVCAALEPRKAPGGLCVLYTRAGAESPVVLYPQPWTGDERVRDMAELACDYTVASSTDEGIVRFMDDAQLESFKTFADAAAEQLENEPEESFVDGDTPLLDRINVKDFNVKRNLAGSLDITKAQEFTFVADEQNPDEDIPEVEDISEPDETPEIEPDENVDNDESVDSGVKPDKLIPSDGVMYSYYGELDAQGDRSGYGRTLTEDGRTAYVGSYLRDKRHGVGSYFYKDGRLCYSGDWVDNARHGVGVGVSSADGSIHVGKWTANKPSGDGVRLSAGGDIRFVCRELKGGGTVLLNFLDDDDILLSQYDENGSKLGEKRIPLNAFSDIDIDE